MLGLYVEDPQDIPTKGRMPVRSAFFGRNEITRRCYDLLREKGTIHALRDQVEAAARSTSRAAHARVRRKTSSSGRARMAASYAHKRHWPHS